MTRLMGTTSIGVDVTSDFDKVFEGLRAIANFYQDNGVMAKVGVKLDEINKKVELLVPVLKDDDLRRKVTASIGDTIVVFIEEEGDMPACEVITGVGDGIQNTCGSQK